MTDAAQLPEVKCAMCGLTEADHRDLYGTPLGTLAFTFRPDTGAEISGRTRLCRPCTHSILPRKLLGEAGVPPEALSAVVWN